MHGRQFKTKHPKVIIWYRYAWNRMGRKDQLCKVLARGKMNSCAVEFEDGHQAITSRSALRRINVNCPDNHPGAKPKKKAT